MAVIVDVIDSNRVLVNSLDFPRSQVNIKNIILTGLVVKVPRNARKAALKKVLAKDNTVQKYSQLAAVKRIALLRKRAKMNDFDRFRVFLAKRQVP
jgi:large subunit ribosomal protein L14e